MLGREITTELEQKGILDNLLNATREGVLVADRDLRILAVNSAAERSFSKGDSSIKGKSVGEVIGNSDVSQAFQAACLENRTSDVHLKYSSNGMRRRFDVHVAPLDLNGSINSIGFFYDVTQIHRLETIRQEFLSNISHELRTPLTSILAFVETLEEGALEDAENNRHFLGVIRRNGERMRNLIADILELSQIETGNIELSRKDIKLSVLVDDMLTSLSSMAASREITLRNEIEPTAVVEADQKRLEQMLTNLVDNAIRFNRRGGSVTVNYSSSPDYHYIHVSDTGEGIVPDQIHRIFERFYRVDRARSRDIGGTGLGLAIVKHLARLHGGEVTVESQLSVGTKFTISLPRT